MTFTLKGFVVGSTVYCERPIMIGIDRRSSFPRTGPDDNDRLEAEPWKTERGGAAAPPPDRYLGAEIIMPRTGR